MERPLRIALVTPGYPTALGGIEMVAGHLAIELIRLGCQVDVLAQWRGDIPPPAGAHTNPRVYWFRSRTRSERFPIAPSLWRHLRRYGDNYDVIYAHGFHAWPAFAAATATDRPLVFSPHYHRVGHTPMARVLHLVYDRPARRIFGRAAAVLCGSAAEASMVRADYPECGQRIHVVLHGVDVEAITVAQPYDRPRPVLLMAGRLEPYKQVGVAIEALSLIGSDVDVELVVLGVGSALAALRQLAAKSGVTNRVRFLGHVDDGELRRWQRTASVVLTLSRHEAFGLILLEGVAAGAAVVASDIPAHREVAALASDKVEFVAMDAEPAAVAAAIRRALQQGRGDPTTARVPTWADAGSAVLEYCRSASGL
jgi:glycosyltransferase involved in cell wall biosynthesis